MAEQKTLNQKAIIVRLQNEISAEEHEAVRKAIQEETFRIEAEITTLDSERSMMDEMMSRQAVDLVGAWEKGNVNQRQELAKSFFPDGLSSATKRHSLNQLTP